MLIIYLICYKYIDELNNCECFVVNKSKQLSIKYIKFYLILEICLMLINIFVNSDYILKDKNRRFRIVVLMPVITMLSFIILLMTAYHVYLLYSSVKEDCKCANRWESYLVYYVGILSMIGSIIYLSLFLLIIYMILLSQCK